MYDQTGGERQSDSRVVQRAPAAAGAGGREALRGMSYAEGTAAVQMAGAGWQGRLTPAQEQASVRYNRARGFSVVTVKRYQTVVRTNDDGTFGPNTAEAIARWQAENGLDPDGKIGPRTQARLDDALGDQTAAAETPGADGPADAEAGPVPAGNLSAHFSVGEFASHDGARTPASVVENLRALAANLEVLREALGGAAMSINSGYRSPAHNRSVGGARDSQHLYGRAADLVVAGHSPRTVKAKIEELIGQGRMKQGGIGLYGSFVHYDTRGSRARW